MPPFTINDVPIQCINIAAEHYHVPALLLISVLKTENGKNGTASLNTNGTVDYGPMQINTVWLNKLNGYHITKADLQFNPCLNMQVGAWILSQRLAATLEISNGIGGYHSQNLSKAKPYASTVFKRYSNLVNQVGN